MALSKKNRLHAKKDFDNIFKNGKAVKGHFLLVKSINTGNSPRAGFIIQAKVAKKAVTRNRIRRILADTVQKNLDIVKKDTVVLVLKLPADKKEEKLLLSKELKDLILKINERYSN